MMNPIKELSEIKINNRLVTGLKMLLGLGNGRMRTALGSEAVTAGMEGRLEDSLQNLEHGLLHDTIHDVGHDHVELHF